MLNVKQLAVLVTSFLNKVIILYLLFLIAMTTIILGSGQMDNHFTASKNICPPNRLGQPRSIWTDGQMIWKSPSGQKHLKKNGLKEDIFATYTVNTQTVERVLLEWSLSR